MATDKMKLTCPNCGAQYEVPDEVVPTAGRDVQCSSCGKTWFQHHPDHMPEEPEDEKVAAELSPTEPAEDDEVAEPPAPRPDPPRRPLDPAVADILREEAEVEFEARRKRQAEPLESQPDLGLDSAAAATPPKAPTPPPTPAPDRDEQRRAEEAKQRMARMRGETEVSAEEAAAAAAISSRRELLPDIEEINSSLRTETTPRSTAVEVREDLGAGGGPKRKGGFRRGLITVLLLFLILALVYVFAPQIAEAVPAVKINLDIYVAWVDGLRVSLDTWVKSMLGSLDNLATEASN